jgi:hypothetical protein
MLEQLAHDKLRQIKTRRNHFVIMFLSNSLARTKAAARA